jgi:mannose-6-phosphate isomerase-like protein (cupin superfamily)
MGITRLDAVADPDSALRAAGLAPYPWSAGAGARFSPHSHAATKHLYVVEGSIDFDGFQLSAGEGILISKGTVHSAVVGESGVTCVEAFGG